MTARGRDHAEALGESVTAELSETRALRKALATEELLVWAARGKIEWSEHKAEYYWGEFRDVTQSAKVRMGQHEDAIRDRDTSYRRLTEEYQSMMREFDRVRIDTRSLRLSEADALHAVREEYDGRLHALREQMESARDETLVGDREHAAILRERLLMATAERDSSSAAVTDLQSRLLEMRQLFNG